MKLMLRHLVCRFSCRYFVLALVCHAMLAALGAGSVRASTVSFDVGNGVAFDTFELSTSMLVPANDNRILIVGFGSVSENFVDVVPTSMRFNGQELTHLGGIVQNVFTDWYARTDIFYMLNPASGHGALDGEVNAARPSGFRQESDWGMYGMVLSGSAQQAPQLVFTAQQNPSAPSAVIGGAAPTTTSGAMLVGFTALNAGFNNLFSTSGVTEDFDTATGDLNFGAGHKLVGANPETFTWTTNGFATGIGTVAIAEVMPAEVMPSDDFVAKLVTGSPSSISQTVDTGANPFTLSFDYLFETTTGVLEVLLGSTSLGTIPAPGTLASDFMSASFLVDGSFLNQTGLALTFLLDGPTGSSLLLDNIAFPGLENGDFESGNLAGWTGQASGAGSVGVARLAQVPEPATLALFLFGLCTCVRASSRARSGRMVYPASR